MWLNSINPGTSFPFKLALVQTTSLPRASHSHVRRTRSPHVRAPRACFASPRPLGLALASRQTHAAQVGTLASEDARVADPRRHTLESQIRPKTHTHTMSAINVTQVQVLVRVFWVSRHAPVVVSLPIG